MQQLFTFFLRVFGIQDGTVAGVEGRYALRSLRDFDHHTGHHLLHLTCKDPLVSLDKLFGKLFVSFQADLVNGNPCQIFL